MSLLPLDIQANYGNLDLVIKEVNRVQNLSEQINYNSSVSIERFSKEIYERIIETDKSSEQQKIENRKKEEERKKKKKHNKNKLIDINIYEEEIKRLLDRNNTESFKGNFVNLLK
jgi:hypothetical protein